MSTPAAERTCPVCGGATTEAACPLDGAETVSVSGFTKDALSYKAGDVISGRYRIQSVIGRGAFGAVYAAEHTGTGHAVAVKMLVLGADQGDGNMVQRFLQEAEVTANLTHPNTVRVFDVGQADEGPLYLVMEMVRGPTLDQVLRETEARKKPMTEVQALEIGIAVCKSLAEAHGAHLVHRDLKPANIMLRHVPQDEPVVKVLDFGCAHAVGSQMTLQGNALGTPAYMSPEQVRGQPLDGRADLYALGAVLFRCMANRLPFQHDVPLTLMFMHVSEDVPDPRELTDQPLSDATVAVLMKALAKNREDRFDDAVAMRKALEEARKEAEANYQKRQEIAETKQAAPTLSELYDLAPAKMPEKSRDPSGLGNTQRRAGDAFLAGRTARKSGDAPTPSGVLPATTAAPTRPQNRPGIYAVALVAVLGLAVVILLQSRVADSAATGTRPLPTLRRETPAPVAQAGPAAPPPPAPAVTPPVAAPLAPVAAVDPLATQRAQAKDAAELAMKATNLGDKIAMWERAALLDPDNTLYSESLARIRKGADPKTKPAAGKRQGKAGDGSQDVAPRIFIQ